MAKLHIRKNDTVMVLAGEDKGKTGKVLKVFVEKERALVEGVNLVSKSQKPSAKNPQGGIVKQEAPIHISNLSLRLPASASSMRARTSFVSLKSQGRRLSNGKYSTIEESVHGADCSGT